MNLDSSFDWTSDVLDSKTELTALSSEVTWLDSEKNLWLMDDFFTFKELNIICNELQSEIESKWEVDDHLRDARWDLRLEQKWKIGSRVPTITRTKTSVWYVYHYDFVSYNKKVSCVVKQTIWITGKKKLSIRLVDSTLKDLFEYTLSIWESNQDAAKDKIKEVLSFANKLNYALRMWDMNCSDIKDPFTRWLWGVFLKDWTLMWLRLFSTKPDRANTLNNIIDYLNEQHNSTHSFT